MKLPEFLIIGAMKCGTTTLYRDLLTNPAVYMPIRKEPHNLCDDDVLTPSGLDKYALHFSAAREGQVRGEASTGYTKLPVKTGVPQRALKVLGPDVKLIYIVRDPVARIISHHYHAYSNGQMSADINQAVVAHADLLDFTRYAMQLEPWIDTFGTERLRIVVFENYVEDRLGVNASICEFLGIDAEPSLIDTQSVYNKGETRALSTRFWQRVARSSSYRRLVRPWLPMNVKDRLRQAALPKAPPRPDPPTEKTIELIRESLKDDQQALQGLLAEVRLG